MLVNLINRSSKALTNNFQTNVVYHTCFASKELEM